MQVKPRVAIFDFACCEGCQLQIVNLEEEILNLIDVVDVVEWREAMSEQSHEYDIAIVEGSITRPEDEKRLEIIRSRAKVLIALGACATTGGINKLKNNFDLGDVKECVYGKDANKPHLETAMIKAVDEVVKVAEVENTENVQNAENVKAILQQEFVILQLLEQLFESA